MITDLSAPLRIALLTHSVNPRGGVVHTLELAEALQAAGHEVTVIAPAAQGQRFFRPVSCRTELARVASLPTDVVTMAETRIAAAAAHLSALLAREQFDVFHAQDSLSGNALATLRQRGLIGGYLRTVHHLDHFLDPRLAAWQLRGFMHADQVLCVSQLWCDALRRDHNIHAALVHNGVNLVRYSPTPQVTDAAVAQRHDLRPGAPLVLAVGGIEERKNTLRLLQAFARLRQQQPAAQLVIAGGASLLNHDAYARAFHDAVAAHGMTTQGEGKAVVITGAVDDAAMPALYRLADVLAMPSLSEGFGLAVLEALACGTPAVAAEIAPFTEHLTDADVCWADPFDTASIAAALARATRRAAFDVPAVCRRFSWSASARRHAQLYRLYQHQQHQQLNVTRAAPCLR